MADVDFFVRNGLVVNNNILVVNVSTSRVGINNVTPDASLSVTGTANVSANLWIGGIATFGGNTLFSGAVQTINGNSNFDSGVLFVDSVNNRIGINNTAPTASLTITGTANVSGVVNFGANVSGPGTSTNLDGFLIDCGTFS